MVISETVDLLSQYRCQEGRDQASAVNGKVKKGEESGQLQFLLRQDELIASKCGHARFYASRAQSDEQKTDHGERGLWNVCRRRGHGQKYASAGINYGNEEYRLELS